MTVTIRDYRDTDYEICRSLWGELAKHHADIYEDHEIAGADPGRGLDEYMRRSDRICTWVAESDGHIVGFVGLVHEVGDENTAEIEPVIVAARTRSSGVGTKLVERVVSEAKKRGFRFLCISPVLRNERAFDLYVRLGFDKIGNIQLFQDLSPASGRKWKSGIKIHNRELNY